MNLRQLFLICFTQFSWEVFANSSLSYSGRLVLASGAPVTGPVNLRAELVYTNATSTVLCSQNLSSVALTKGVFHLKLDFDCTPKTITQVLSETPNGESVAIRIIDQTNSKTYPLQAIHSVPFSKVAEQLPQMGASSGQALVWNGSKWEPTSVGTGNGTVMSVTAGTGLSGGTITTTGTIGIASGGVGTLELANNSVTAAKINAGEITSTHISATANIPYSKLQIGIGEIPQDRINGLASSMSTLIEDVIADAVTGKAPSQNAVYDALGLKADRSNVTQNITAASLTGLTAPIAGSDAANKTYVDNSATTLDTRITNEVATLNTALGNKYDKAGGVITGDVTLNTQMLLKGGSNFVTLKANSGTANYVMTLPTSAGTNGYVLQTDGAGVLSWVNPSFVVTGSGTVNSASITDGSIVDADINASANIAQSKILNLTTDLANKQPLINSGTTAQYYRGDKTFVDFGTDVRGSSLTGFVTGANSTVLNTDTMLSAFQKVQGQINATNTAVTNLTTTNVAEGTNLYFTEPRVLGVDLLGFDNTLVGPIVATDSVLQAFGRTQKQINDITTSLAGNQWSAGGGNVYRTSGNVGVGTSTPTKPLDIAGSARIVDAVVGARQLTINGGSATYVQITNSTSGTGISDGVNLEYNGHNFNISNNENDATFGGPVQILSAGTSNSFVVNREKVGIGDYSPDANFEISLNAITTGNAFLVSSNDDSDGDLLTMTKLGNIGVGTTTPTQKLDVNGNVKATQFCLGADCKSAWPVGLSSGSVTTTEILDGTIATADIADGAVSLVKLGGARDGTKYLKGDNTWSTFATDAINSVLSTFTVGTGTKPAVTNSDTVVGAFGKVQKTLNDINADYVSKSQDQTINGILAINSVTGFITVPTPINPDDAANKAYVDSFGQWLENGVNIYYNTGNVGIGTTTPASKLSVIDGAGARVLAGGAIGAGFELNDANTRMDIPASNTMALYTSNNERLRIDSVGNVGIGTTTPLSPLQLGSVFVLQQDINSGYIGANFGSGTSGNYIKSQYSNQIMFDSATGNINFKVAPSGTAGNAITYVNAMMINAAGKVGIGTTTPTAQLEVAGQIVSRIHDNAAGTTFDFNNGNNQYTSASCGAYTLSNMQDGGTYQIIVKGTTSATCSFIHAGLIVKLPPGHSATTAGTHTIYSFLRAGNDVYVSWVPGY